MKRLLHQLITPAFVERPLHQLLTLAFVEWPLYQLEPLCANNCYCRQEMHMHQLTLKCFCFQEQRFDTYMVYQLMLGIQRASIDAYGHKSWGFSRKENVETSKGENVKK